MNPTARSPDFILSGEMPRKVMLVIAGLYRSAIFIATNERNAKIRILDRMMRMRELYEYVASRLRIGIRINEYANFTNIRGELTHYPLDSHDPLTVVLALSLGY